MQEFEVSWTFFIEGENPRDAAMQAAAIMEDGIKYPDAGASILIVKDMDGNIVGGFDEWGKGEDVSNIEGNE